MNRQQLQDKLRALGIPDVIDRRYAVNKVLGKGGMGAVVRAEDKLRNQYAIKVMLPGMNQDTEFVQRFKREAEAMNKVDHPNIMTVKELSLGNGLEYIVMDYVEGSDLGVKSKEGIEVEEAVEIIEKTARGLHAAHEKGITHRDIKPDNILVRNNGEPLLADFGLARVDKDIGHDTEELQRLTMDGIILGTPQYMAPEQITGLDTDNRTDIWGLAASLFTALTGTVPFPGDDMITLYNGIHEDPLPQTRNFNPEISEDLDLILGKAMAKSPFDRYNSAAEFADDLHAFLNDEPLSFHVQDDPGQLATILAKYKRNAVIGLASLGLVVAGAFGYHTMQVANQEAKGQVALTQAYSDLKKNNYDEALAGFKTARALLSDDTEVNREIEATIAQKEQHDTAAKVKARKGAQFDQLVTDARVLLQSCESRKVTGETERWPALWPEYAIAKSQLEQAAQVGKLSKDDQKLLRTAKGTGSLDILTEDGATILAYPINTNFRITGETLLRNKNGRAQLIYGSKDVKVNYRDGNRIAHNWQEASYGQLISILSDSTKEWTKGPITEPVSLGTTSDGSLKLDNFPMGNYMLLIKHPGDRDTRYHMLVSRNESETIRGDSKGRSPLPLFSEREIGKGQIYIPAGKFSYLGKEEWADGFILAQHELTNREYATYISAMSSQGRDMSKHLPRWNIKGTQATRWESSGPRQASLELPVQGVPLRGAYTYLKWLKDKGIPASFPSYKDLCKAAGGVDNRVYSWGNTWQEVPGKTNAALRQYVAWMDVNKKRIAPLLNHQLPSRRDFSPYLMTLGSLRELTDAGVASTAKQRELYNAARVLLWGASYKDYPADWTITERKAVWYNQGQEDLGLRIKRQLPK
jgi:hypothetical protein